MKVRVENVSPRNTPEDQQVKGLRDAAASPAAMTDVLLGLRLLAATEL
jgi:hypothetical protein